MSTNAFSSQTTKGQWLQTIAIRIAFAPALSSSDTVFPDSGSGSCDSSDAVRGDSLFATRSVTGQVQRASAPPRTVAPASLKPCCRSPSHGAGACAAACAPLHAKAQQAVV